MAMTKSLWRVSLSTSRWGFYLLRIASVFYPFILPDSVWWKPLNAQMNLLVTYECNCRFYMTHLNWDILYIVHTCDLIASFSWFNSNTIFVWLQVQRGQRVLDKIFIHVVIAMVIVAYINMGCAIDLQVIKQTLRKPVAPAIGLASQYLFMPLVSLICRLLYDLVLIWTGNKVHYII